MIVFLAMLLDGLLGEPKWLWSRIPHPAVLMGKAVGALDRRMNTGPNRKHKGIRALIILVIGAWIIGWLITLLPGVSADVILSAILIAQRSLVDHVQAVANGLNRSLADGRAVVAMIVSRDTSAMDDSAVARSAIESGAENLSDGVIAPVLFLAFFGLPGLMVYKVVNTADSMIGYMTPKYRAFGWAAARLDDVLNWVPARLTALLICLSDRRASLRDVRRDARKHRSPNAGWPEAAMAFKHNIALSGPRSYAGEMYDFPYVNPRGKKALKPTDISASITTLWLVWGFALVLVPMLALILPF